MTNYIAKRDLPRTHVPVTIKTGGQLGDLSCTAPCGLDAARIIEALQSAGQYIQSVYVSPIHAELTHLRHLRRKQEHGCTDAFCAICD
jgi:hypothetical protein